MSFCKSEGKDKVVFVTKEDHEQPSTARLEEYNDGEPGLIKEDGEINWNCPCLGGMATGPWGYEFRSAFSCFHYSTADPKGSDCYDAFRDMQDCMVKFPSLYDSASDDKDDDDDVADVFSASEDAGKSKDDNNTSKSSEVQKHSGDTAKAGTNNKTVDTNKKQHSWCWTFCLSIQVIYCVDFL